MSLGMLAVSLFCGSLMMSARRIHVALLSWSIPNDGYKAPVRWTPPYIYVGMSEDSDFHSEWCECSNLNCRIRRNRMKARLPDGSESSDFYFGGYP